MVECPTCAGSLEIGEGTETGELVTCKDCGSNLEVTGMSPVKVQPAPEVEEDWGE